MTEGTAPVAAYERGLAALRADCASCFALCCVALPFAASADFAIDKPAGVPCPNLRADARCQIHDRLRDTGFPGCSAYDCFGAGQHVSQVTFGGRHWRDGDPASARAMFDSLPVVQQLHELLWYLMESLTLPPARRLHGAVREQLTRTEALAAGSADDLRRLNMPAHRRQVAALLRRVSGAVRRTVPGPRVSHRNADLIGRDLRSSDLRGADLGGAYLIEANLAGVDLTAADLIGADLRGADLRGADLSSAFFLTQPRLAAATGDGDTGLPPALRRPLHWLVAGRGDAQPGQR